MSPADAAASGIVPFDSGGADGLEGDATEAGAGEGAVDAAMDGDARLVLLIRGVMVVLVDGVPAWGRAP